MPRGARFWRRLGIAAVAPLALAAAWEQWQLLQTLLARPWANAIDYRLYRAAATIGFQQGWSRIYDANLQREAIAPLWSHGGVPSWWTSSQPFWTPFISPPPVAWLAAPSNALPVAIAGNVWLAVVAVALALSAALIAPSLRAAPLYLALPLLTWASALSVASGNIAPLVGLAVVICWRQAEQRHEVIAGLVLALATVKPQVMFAVPLLLWLSGRQQLFKTWLIGAVVIAGLSAATLQQQGLSHLLNLARLVAGYPHERQLSALAWAGSPVLDAVVAAAIAGLALAAVYRMRARGAGVPIAVGLVTSLLLSPYLNFEDFVLLVPAALLLLRSRLGVVVDVLAIALALSATPASQGYVTPEIVVGLILLAVLASRPAPSRVPGSAAPGVAPGPRTPSPAG